jgi:hypothetical protein
MALVLALAATACGGSDGGRPPTKAEISKELQQGDMPKAVADCLAAKIVAAKLTDDEIDAYLDDPKAKSEAATILSAGYLDCAQVTVGG